MRSVHKTMMRAACMALLVGTGCGEESNPNDPDGGTPVDGHVADSGNHLPVDAGDVDAGDVDVDAGDVDAGTPPA